MKLTTYWYAQATISICAFLSPPLYALSFRAGDVVVNDFGRGSLQVYSSDGNLRSELSGTGGLWFGASVFPGGDRLVTTHRMGQGGVNIFSTDGSEFTFLTPDVDIAGDVSVFLDGTLAVSSQLTNRVELYTSAGTHLGGFPTIHPQPTGSAVGLSQTLWVCGAFGQGLFGYAQDGAFIRSIPTGFPVGDVAVDPQNGSLWVTSKHTNQVFNFDESGNLLGSFTTAITPGGLGGQSNFRGIAVLHDHSLYVTSELSQSVFHYSSAGQLLDSFPLQNASRPMYMAVVGIPEPSAATLLLTMLIGVAGPWSVYVRHRSS